MSGLQHHRRAALVTGAAGRVGQQLCAELARQGKNIIGLYREKLPRAHKNVLPLCCDLRQIESLVPPLKSTDTVVHLAWQDEFLQPQAAAENPEYYAKNSTNVVMTQNLIHAMERAGTKRIIFLSWVGVDRHAEQPMLRQKYWAENAVINSQIPEKIIIRAGLISSPEHLAELTRVAGMIAKFPLLLPVPRGFEDVVVTTMADVLRMISDSLRDAAKSEPQCKIIDLASTHPSSLAAILRAVDAKVWNKKRLQLNGFLGQWLYQCLDKKLGFSRRDAARLTDYFDAASLPQRSPAQGLPATPMGISEGLKQDIAQVL
jgi:uncharacterized protein YbjT (DUF2867 family)